MTLPEVLTLERPLIGMDTETTGTNPTSSRIVELALEIMKPGELTREYRTLVNPLMPIPPGATAVHGITDRMVQACRTCDGDSAQKYDDSRPCSCPAFKPWPTFDQIADNLLKGFAGADFCGYNVRFDLRMFAAEFRRVQRTWDYEGARVIDAHRLWQVGEARSLIDATKRWKDKFPKDWQEDAGVAHTALHDTRCATRVIAAQLREFAALPRDVQRLHDLCSPGWFDAEGKLQWREGELCISFGQHRDTPLSRVPKSYLLWILKGDFSTKVKDVCREATAGRFPTPPAHLVNVD